MKKQVQRDRVQTLRMWWAGGLLFSLLVVGFGALFFIADVSKKLSTQDEHVAAGSANFPTSELSKNKETTLLALPDQADKPQYSVGNTDIYSSYGAFLAGRHAASKQDASSAARFLSAALASTNQAEILAAPTLRAQILAGEIQAAYVLIEALNGRNIYMPSVPLVGLSYAFKHRNAKQAAAQIEAISSGAGWIYEFKTVLQMWGELLHPHRSAQAALRKPAKAVSSYFRGFITFQKALFYDAKGKNALAQASYEQAVNDPIVSLYRVVLLTADFYQRQNKQEMADSLLQGFFEDWKKTNPLLMHADYEDQKPYFYHDLAALKRPKSKNYMPAFALAELFYTSATFLYKQELYADALLYAQLAYYLNPKHNDLLLLMGGIHEDAGHPHQAIQAYRKIHGRGNVQLQASIKAAQLIYDVHGIDAALTYLEEAQTHFPRHPWLLGMRPKLLADEERYQEAVDGFSSVLAMDSVKKNALQEAELYFRRAAAYDALNQWPKAKADLEQALQRVPNSPDILNYLGYSMLIHNEPPQQAVELLQQALELDPESAHIQDSLGWAYYQMQEYDKAYEYINMAADTMPSSVVVLDHYGDVLWRLGRYEEARHQWRQALDFEEDAKEVSHEQLRQKIKHGLPPLVGASKDNATHEAP